MPRSLPLAAAAFAALACLVAAGALSGVDQWATTHLMPALEPSSTYEATLGSIVRPVSDGGSPFELAADAWLYPASVPLSLLAVCACAYALFRRGRRLEAALWPAAWIAANAVEVLVKDVVAKPPLYGDGVHVLPFDDSFPSGHSLRSALVAAAVLAVAPRLGRAAAVWAAGVLVLLVPAAWHTPSDVAGGLLLALVAVAAVRTVTAAESGARIRPMPTTLDDPLSTGAEPAPHQADAAPRAERGRAARAPRAR